MFQNYQKNLHNKVFLPFIQLKIIESCVMISLKSKFVIMKKLLLLLVTMVLTTVTFGQEKAAEDTSWKKTPRYTPERINNLVHTKLDVKFDYDKSYLYGKAWITLTPHFSPTARLTLDAKGMEIKKLNLVSNNNNRPLKFEYNNEQINIQLDKTYKKGEKYTVYVEYTAKPDEGSLQ